MIKRLSGASIWSEDLQKNLLPFYRDVVGLPVAIDTPGFVVLGRNPREAGRALVTHSDVKGRNGDAARHMIAFEVDDVDAETKRLKSKGVEFIEEPNSPGQVRIATFKDPEGNYVQILQFL